MQIFNKFLIQQTILFALVYCSHCKPNWNYELTNVYAENLTPDVITIDLSRSTIRRGVYAISGTIDIKQDLTDDFRIETDLLLSRTGIKGSYVKTPIFANNSSISEFGKKMYEPYFMDTIINCCENPWQLTNGQLEPLTKRLMKLNNCVINTDKMPSHMTNGYYRILLSYKNQAEGTLIIDVTISTD